MSRTLTADLGKGRFVQRSRSILLTAMAVLMSIAVPAGAAAQGFTEAEMGVGFFYGTFGEDPNTLLFVGGSAEEFCLDNPEDPFNAEPGSATYRIIDRESGATDIMTNTKSQPVYLYHHAGEAPDLLFETCDALFDGNPSTNPLEPFAIGTGDLKVRLGIAADGTVDVFNSVNGKVSASDGTQSKVRASADLQVVDGVPLGDPADFVSLEVHQIGS
jgi:hypothetical protein